MTEPIDGQEQEIVFTDEQQKFVNKLLGKTRIEGRAKGKADAEAAQEAATADAEREQLAAAAEWKKLSEMHEGRVTELEPFEAEAKAYRELIKGMLADKVKALGDKAKAAVKGLPEGLSDLDKLNWLAANQELFEADVRRVPGTPAAKVKKAAGKSGRPEGHRKLHL